MIEERKWRVRLSRTFLALLVWGILWVTLLMFADGMRGTLVGVLLLVVLAGGLGYYFGAGEDRIASIPTPRPEFAASFGRSLVWMYPILLAVGLLGAWPLIRGWYGLEPTPSREIATFGTVGMLCLMAFLGIPLWRWRSTLIKIGKGTGESKS